MTMAAEIKKRMGPGAASGGERPNLKIDSTPVMLNFHCMPDKCVLNSHWIAGYTRCCGYTGEKEKCASVFIKLLVQ